MTNLIDEVKVEGEEVIERLNEKAKAVEAVIDRLNEKAQAAPDKVEAAVKKEFKMFGQPIWVVLAVGFGAIVAIGLLLNLV